MARTITIAGMLLGLLALPTPASAGQLEDFQFAQTAYDAGEYQQAAQRFTALLPALTSDILIRESRVYLAASYVHLGTPARAEEQFRALLEDNHDFEVEEHRFSEAVLVLFHQVRTAFLQRLGQSEAAEVARLEQIRQLRIERMLRQRERMQQLEEIARHETVERENSRALALLPFGVGQFRNDNRGLGVGLASAEAILFAGSIATWAWHRWLLGQRNESASDERRSNFNDSERIARISNQTVTGLFAAVAIAGIIEAQIRFRPVIREIRDRDLPDDLPVVDPDPEPQVDVSIGFGTASLRLRF